MGSDSRHEEVAGIDRLKKVRAPCETRTTIGGHGAARRGFGIALYSSPTTIVSNPFCIWDRLEA